MQLRDYQQAAIDAVYDHLRNRDDNPCVVLPTGCHQAGHPVLMFDGSVKPVEEIAVGDRVMGPDSQPREVKELCRGVDEMFKVFPTKGEPFVVNGAHVLSLVCTNEGKLYPSARRGGEIENVTVNDFLERSISWRHLRKLYRVGVEFPNRSSLPIPPYILGLLIGDGCLRDGVSLTTADETIAGEWSRYVKSIGCEIYVNDHGGRCPTYGARFVRGHANILTESLKALGLHDSTSETKFIPDCYLTATRQERLELIAGLMDTDGSCHRAGFDYITSSRELAADIVFLSRSLGLAAFTRRKHCVCQTGEGGWYFRVGISGEMKDIPCRLPRKRPPRRRQIKSVNRTGFTIESVGKGNFFGFVLDRDHLYVDGNFVVHHNSGKTPVIATLCRDAVKRWNGRVLVLSHVKELLEQSAETLRRMAPDLEVGVHSAGLKKRDTAQPVIVAGIQSIYKRACELDAFDLILVDEAHLLPPDGEGMYQQFLADTKIVNPNVRLIGLTATPYRLKSGMLYAPENLLNHICFEIGVKELINRGFLSPLKTKAGKLRADYGQLHIRGGEFVRSEIETLMDTEDLVRSACREIANLTADRKSVLIFTASVAHASHVRTELERITGSEVGWVTGNSDANERAETIERFKGKRIATSLFGDSREPLKYLVNVNVLTTGFDAPNVDCVVLMRPTASAGLYYQMVGRGFRLHPDKDDCLVLDYGDNILRHGPVDAIEIREKQSGNQAAPVKECPECQEVIHASYAVCPECGFAFPVPERRQHNGEATNQGILSGEAEETEYEVLDVFYNVHVKKDADENTPRSMRVEYRVGLNEWQREWVCVEHTGFARKKAHDWWRKHSPDPFPETAQRAVEIAEGGGLAIPAMITVRKVTGERFDRIVDCRLGPMPEPVEVETEFDYDLSEIPF